MKKQKIEERKEIEQFIDVQWAIKEITRENFKILASNENENTIFQNLKDTIKVVLREKINSYKHIFKKSERSYTDNLICISGTFNNNNNNKLNSKLAEKG